jgi:hypothetical protein
LQRAKGMLACKKVADQTPALVTSVAKKIFAYTKTGLVQQQDKIVARFALTIYPYSLYDIVSIVLGFSMSAFTYCKAPRSR